MFLKVADLAALESDYYKAIENYEKVAKASVNNGLMKWSVKDYFLKAGICHLASGVRLANFTRPYLSCLLTHIEQDLVATQRALASYIELDQTFQGTREHQLLVDLTGAVEQGDNEQFADRLFQYDQLSKLDRWKTTILLRVKNAIEEKGEDFS